MQPLKIVRCSKANLIPAVFCTITVVCLAVSIVLWFRPLYYGDMRLLEISGRSGYSQEICRRNYDALIDYNTIGGSHDLEFADMNMSGQGRIHFEEVRQIFLPVQAIGITGTAVLALIYFSSNKKRWMHRGALLSAAIALMAIIAITADGSGKWAFEAMHRVLFDNDYWIFSPRTDPVIKILPYEFFIHCGVMIIALTIAISAGLELLYRRSIRNGKT